MTPERGIQVLIGLVVLVIFVLLAIWLGQQVF